MKYSKYSLLLFVLIISVIAVACLEGAKGGGVGGVVIDAPRKTFKAEIYGKVLSPDGPIAGADVEIAKYNLKGKTDSQGNYSFEISTLTKLGVNRIRILVRATMAGFQQRTQGVYVTIREKAMLDINLIPQKY